ncbi:MAG: DUF2971 domain-containing protein [Pseudomonas sp.]
MDRGWVKQLIENISVATVGELDVPALINDKILHTPKQLFKIRACGDFALQNLEAKTLFLGTADAFNDPYDTAFWADSKRIAAADKLAEMGVDGEHVAHVLRSSDPIASVIELASSQAPNALDVDGWLHEISVLSENFQMGQLPWLIQELQSSYKICSLSERIDSVLMWSHYGFNHTGFAMEYDFTRDHRNDASTLCLWPVAYTSRLFDITEILIAKRQRKEFNALYGIAASLCKAVDWQYEREWRLVIPEGNERRSLNLAVPLKAVHLGARISVENRASILSICERINVPVYQVKLAPHEYKMISEPVGRESDTLHREGAG